MTHSENPVNSTSPKESRRVVGVGEGTGADSLFSMDALRFAEFCNCHV